MSTVLCMTCGADTYVGHCETVKYRNAEVAKLRAENERLRTALAACGRAGCPAASETTAAEVMRDVAETEHVVAPSEGDPCG